MIEKAVLWALNAHHGQFRKGTNVPYIIHPVNVGMTLSRAGCTDAVITAGILHDTIEDTYVTLEMLIDLFGEEVAFIVQGCTEGDKKFPWQERKRRKLKSLESAPSEVRIVTCADKLDNVRSMAALYAELGSDAWRVFNAGYELQRGYYHDLVRVLCKSPHQELYPKLFTDLKKEIEALFGKVRDERLFIAAIEDDEKPTLYDIYLVNNSNIDFEMVHKAIASSLSIDEDDYYHNEPTQHTYDEPLHAGDRLIIDSMFDWDFDYAHTFDFKISNRETEIQLHFYLDRLFPIRGKGVVPVINKPGYVCYPDKVREIIKQSEWDDIEHLEDLNDNPELLLEMGFRRVDEHTTDTIRMVWFKKRIETAGAMIEMNLVIEFELAISDYTEGPDTDNYNYLFNCVYLESHNKRTGTNSRNNISIYDIEDMDRFCMSIEE